MIPKEEAISIFSSVFVSESSIFWYWVLLGLANSNLILRCFYDFRLADDVVLFLCAATVWCSTMTITPKISVNDGNLVVHGKTILTGVPDNIVLTPGSGQGLIAGAFIGATASHSKSLHVFPVGVLE